MIPSEDGVYKSISWADYQRIPRLNLSKLKHMEESPFHFRAAELEQEEDTEARLIGRATHTATLEPENWLARYAIWDGGTRRGKDWDKFKKENEGQDILTADQRDRVIAIQKAVRGDEFAAKYLRDGSAEVTVLWTHVEPALGPRPGFEVRCKGRLDFTGAGIVDLKTTRSARPEKFFSQSWEYAYHVAAGWYSDGLAAATNGELRPFRLLAVASKAPHAVQVFHVGAQLQNVGRATYRGWLAQLQECRATGRYRAYAEGELELEPPRWVKNQADNEDTSGLDLEFEEEQPAHA